jgi:membrane-bound serine protease (ClpP class)
MNFLLDPTISYLLLVFGILLALLALLSPGTGILEIAALFILLLAGYGVYNLEISWWALIVLLGGVGFFLIALRRYRQPLFLVLAILAFIAGSAYLYSGENWWQPGVNPLLAVIVSLLSSAFIWIATRRVLDARRSRPSHDLKALIGAVGEAKTAIHIEGSVQVAGELWSARSNEPIPDGAAVRVIARDGFILEVEAVPQP